MTCGDLTMNHSRYIFSLLGLLASLLGCNFYKYGHFYYGGYPAISPNGKIMIFAGIETEDLPASASNIYKIDLGNGNVTRLARRGSNASISPNGKKVVYGSKGIWIMDIDGRNGNQLIDAWYSESYPSFSPDGHKIVFGGYFQEDD